jgi:predicted nucleic acid-binding protein
MRRMKVLLDTNILLRLLEPGHSQHRAAFAAVELLAGRSDTLCVVPQNVYEFWVVSTRPLKENGRGKLPDEVLAEVAFLESNFTVLPETPDVFSEWKRLMTMSKRIGKPAHDARFVAAMIVHNLSHILTFNHKDFYGYTGITAINPATIA